MKIRLGIKQKLLPTLAVLLTLGSVAGFGASPYQPIVGDPMLEPWRWRTFPELSGLGAQCIAEGPSGSVWFGTVEGVWSYNGFEWVHHLEAGTVTSLGTGTDGSLYLGTRADIRRFSDGQWSRIFNSRGRTGDLRKLITARDGSLWVATAGGALHCQQSHWTLYTVPEVAARLQSNQSQPAVTIELLPTTVTAKARTNSLPARRQDFTEVCEDRQGRIWLGTDGGEILCFDPAAGKWSIYNETDGVACGRTPSILPLQNGMLWVVYGSASGYLNEFDGAAWRTTALADAGVPGDGGNLLQTRDGTVWLSGRYVLAACRDGRWQTYEKPAVPIPSARNFILETSDGALWIAGPSTEIQRVDYGTSHWLTLRDLNFQWESPAGAQWFLHRDGRIVVQETNRWTSYGVEDGLMDAPVALLGTRSGEVWAAGSHEHTAATARFADGKWTRFIHDEFSWGVDWRGVMESSDGSVWFSAAVDSSGPKKHCDGILQFRDGIWTHHHQPGRAFQNETNNHPEELLPATQRPEPIGKFLCLGESRDGKIWAGRNIIIARDPDRWRIFSPPQNLRFGIIETMFTTRERELWVGTRQYGALRYDGQHWQSFQGRDSLVANTVRSITQTTDGSIWAATDRGITRFDGHTWTPDVLPEPLSPPNDGGSLKAAPSGRLWINRFVPDWNIRAWPKAPRPDATNYEFWTVCHQFKDFPPRTTITAGAKQVSPPGNLSLLWSGADPWHQSKDAQLQYSFRLDDQPWSAFTTEQGHSFFTLPPGAHHFEVRARDRDFNVDPTPATLDFVVLPPVWRQGWFLLLMIVLVGLILAQSIRVLLEQARLRAAHGELEDRVRQRTAQLEAANKELETFSYSVSHDLRAPLRAIEGFSQILLEDNAAQLDAEGKANLQRVCAASQRMGHLIDDLLELSRITRSELRRAPVDLSALARSLADDLQHSEPGRRVEFAIEPGLTASADAGLMQVVLQNLLGNAWKFTGKQPWAKIEFGRTPDAAETVYFVRDNGVGFDMTYAGRLFGAFQRLHAATEFPGTGIGLATVQRIVHRHGGHIWAESQEDRGATFYFTLPTEPQNL